MCVRCKASEIGIARQKALDEAAAKCKELNINPATMGFIVNHAYQGHVPGGRKLNATPEQIEAVKQHVAASDAMKKLHDDYVWDRGRQYVAEMSARGVKPVYFTHGDKR